MLLDFTSALDSLCSLLSSGRFFLSYCEQFFLPVLLNLIRRFPTEFSKVSNLYSTKKLKSENLKLNMASLTI